MKERRLDHRCKVHHWPIPEAIKVPITNPSRMEMDLRNPFVKISTTKNNKTVMRASVKLSRVDSTCYFPYFQWQPEWAETNGCNYRAGNQWQENSSQALRRFPEIKTTKTLLETTRAKHGSFHWLCPIIANGATDWKRHAYHDRGAPTPKYSIELQLKKVATPTHKNICWDLNMSVAWLL